MTSALMSNYGNPELEFERGKGCPVLVEMLRLAPRFPVEGNAEPGQILENARLEGRGAAGDVDIFEPQQQPAALRIRRLPVEQGGERVAEMQPAVW